MAYARVQIQHNDAVSGRTPFAPTINGMLAKTKSQTTPGIHHVGATRWVALFHPVTPIMLVSGIMGADIKGDPPGRPYDIRTADTRNDRMQGNDRIYKTPPPDSGGGSGGGGVVKWMVRVRWVKKQMPQTTRPPRF